MDMAELFQKLMDKNNKPSARKIVANPDICDIVINRTSWLPRTAGIAERLWNLFHSYSGYNKCCLRCGESITAFRSWTDGYLADYCSKSCQRKTGRKPKQKLSLEQRELNKTLAKEKRKQTFVERYGVTSNFSRNTGELRKKRFISKFIAARDDISLVSDINEYDGNRQQLKWMCNECNTQFEENIFSGPQCPTCFTPNASTGQHEVNTFIRSLGFTTRLNDRKLSKNKFELDIWIPEKHVCFEYDGLYWHSEKGRPDIKKQSLLKHEWIKNTNVKPYYIFEDDWQNKQDIIKGRIKVALGVAEVIQARNTEFCSISSKEAAEFCDLHHLQGRAACAVAYALKYRGEIVSLMTFSKPRFNKHADAELVRYCSLTGLIVVGGAEKLWKNIIKSTTYNTVISYSDNRWGFGKIYENIGFKNDGQTGQGYFYINRKGERISRSTLQKSKLKASLKNYDEKLSERDNCWNNFLYRVWDLGNTRWIWSRN